ncbi:hypothetical protein GCM10027443_07210 [Pontibacter brevis]
MKNSIYKLLFVLCLLTGVSCTQEEAATTETQNETTAETDTTATTNDDVPESLMHH